MADENNQELTQEQKEELKKKIDDQLQKLGEVYSQCWESEEFKKAFMEDPKAIFEEYDVNYDNNKEYRIIDTPEKTIIHVLPYEGIKPAMEKLTEALSKNVKDLSDEASKQILLEDWKWQIYQCTEDVIYMPIPLCPDNLTPEELEMVNGGCLLFAAFFVFVAEAVGTITSVAAVLELAVAATVFMAGAVFSVGAAVVLVNTLAAWTNVGATGALVLQFNTSLGIQERKPE
ncbi:MAG: hypothetical protein K6B28_03275 [Lachnospiraceae bacterium]|nr:hypothetical protein [Lachnospiraceae bacterium]